MYESRKPDALGYVDYPAEENETWAILYNRQYKVIQNRACNEFIEGIHLLGMPADHIPQCPEMNERLGRITGWGVEPVAKIIPLKKFFELLANKRFPAATFIRKREELDYLKEPDIFHEIFGHCPLLTNQAYADFAENYGKLALQASPPARSFLGRLWWFTIEFGLLRTPAGLRIYGGGILSSYEESIYALESPLPKRVNFDIQQIMASTYRYDELQKLYYILNSLDDLFQIGQLDLLSLANAAQNQDEISEERPPC